MRSEAVPSRWWCRAGEVLLAAVLLVACGDAPGPDAAADRAAYLVSVRQQPRDAVAAAAACTQIDDSALRGECTALIARDLAAAGGDAWSACRGLRPGRWRDLCTFEAIDGTGDFGAEVAEACQSTGDFRQRCLDHALVRHAAREWAELAPGDEEAMVRWLRMKVDEYNIIGNKQALVHSIAGRAIATRQRSAGAGDFSREACGAVEPAVCREAFESFLRHLSRTDRFAQLCRDGISAQRVRAAELPAWQDNVVDDIPGVIGEVCRARTGQDPLVLSTAG
jgi:hypothetical protein